MSSKTKCRPTRTKDVAHLALPIAKLEKSQNTFAGSQFLKLKKLHVFFQRFLHIVLVSLLLSFEKCHTLVYGEGVNRNALKSFPERCYKNSQENTCAEVFFKKESTTFMKKRLWQRFSKVNFPKFLENLRTGAFVFGVFVINTDLIFEKYYERPSILKNNIFH